MNKKKNRPKQVKMATYKNNQIVQLPLSKLTIADTNVRTYEVKHHPKREEEWEMLKSTIKEHGIIEPVIIAAEPITLTDNRDVYRVISGQRRIEALKELGEKHVMVTCIAKEFDSREDEIITSLISNAQRKDVHARDLAYAIQQLENSGMTVTEISKTTGWSRKHIYSLKNYLTFPDEIRRDQLKGKHIKGHEMSDLAKHFDGKEKKVSDERDQEIIEEEAKRFSRMGKREREEIIKAASEGKDIGKELEKKEKARKSTLGKTMKPPKIPYSMPLDEIPDDPDAQEIVHTLHPWVEVPTKIEKESREWFPFKEELNRVIKVSPEAYKKIMDIQKKYNEFTRSEIINAIIIAVAEESIAR